MSVGHHRVAWLLRSLCLSCECCLLQCVRGLSPQLSVLCGFYILAASLAAPAGMVRISGLKISDLMLFRKTVDVVALIAHCVFVH